MNKFQNVQGVGLGVPYMSRRGGLGGGLGPPVNRQT